jgi:uncharacterized protein (TIGR03905 family)
MNLEELTPSGAGQSAQEADTAKVFVPKGVCSKMIRFEVEDGKLHNVEFTGGCPGNLIGIGRLVEGMPLTEVAERLRGIRCGRKSTSCPDQLVEAITPYIEG